MTPARRINPELVLVHWLVALVVLCALSAIVLRGLMPAGHPWRPALRHTHLVAGQLVLLGALVRVAVRWRSTLAPLPGAPLWQLWASRATHALLYVVMLGQPLTGVLFMQAGDKDVALFGLVWPQLVGSSTDLHFQLKDAHLLMGNLAMGLIALHAGAALWHHLVRRDDTLRRMLMLRAAPVGAADRPADLPGTRAPSAGAVASRSIDRARARAADAAPIRADVPAARDPRSQPAE